MSGENWQDKTPLNETPADDDEFLLRDISDTVTDDSPDGSVVPVSYLNVIGAVLKNLRDVFIPASASSPSSLDLHEDTDNGSSRVRITAPAALGDDRTLTAPDATGTIARTADITFETLDAAGDVGTGAAQVAAGNHAHAASAITSGSLVHERGGLEADVSAYDGVVRISSGATSALALGIANDALLQAKNSAGSGEFARFTAAGIEGLTEAELKAAANLEIGTDVQAWDAQLDTWATVTPSSNGQSLVAAANYAAMRGLLDLEAGTDFYSISAADALLAAKLALAGGTLTGEAILGSGGSINDAGPITTSGTLVRATHGGRVIVTSGNVVIPNSSGDVGMGGVIVAGGAHTISFNSTATAALAAGDVFTYYVLATNDLLRSLQPVGARPLMT